MVIFNTVSYIGDRALKNATFFVPKQFLFSEKRVLLKTVWKTYFSTIQILREINFVIPMKPKLNASKNVQMAVFDLMKSPKIENSSEIRVAKKFGRIHF